MIIRNLATPPDRIQRWTRPTLVLACAAGLASVSGPAFAAGKSVTHTVVMQTTSYAPLARIVKRGDTVVWVNKDPFPHTATAREAFDSKSIAAGSAWKYKARKTGEYAYTCTFHPKMKGTLRVE